MSCDWRLERLGNVCELQNGFAFKSKLFKQSGIQVLRISSIQNEGICDNRPVFTDPTDYTEDLSRFYVEDEDLLIAMSGATTGKIGFNRTGKKYLLNQRVGKFIPNNKLNIYFLFYFLSTRIEENLSISTGSAQPNLSTKQIKDFQIPLPPLPEQKRIVEILDKAFEGIDAAIANTEQNLANARELFESYLSRLMPRGDSTWSNTTLGQTCQFFNGKAHEKCIDESGAFIVVNSKFISSDGNVIKRTNDQMFPLFKNDIVMVMSDVPKGKALAKCYQIEIEKLYSLNQRICCIRSSNFLPDYLKFQLNRHPFLLAFDNKGSQANLRKHDILSCPLYLPSLEEQKKLFNQLNTNQKLANKVVMIYEAKLESLKELKQSFLQKAFSGELTK